MSLRPNTLPRSYSPINVIYNVQKVPASQRNPLSMLTIVNVSGNLLYAHVAVSWHPLVVPLRQGGERVQCVLTRATLLLFLGKLSRSQISYIICFIAFWFIWVK